MRTLRFDPAHPHTYLVADLRDPMGIIGSKECFGCHAMGVRRQGQVGPALDRDEMVTRLQARLGSAAYRQAVAALDQRQGRPFRSYRDARHEVLAAKGIEQVKLWIGYRLCNPRFDDPNVSMPLLGLSAGEASLLAEFLVRPIDQGPPGWRGTAKRLATRILPAPGYKHLLLAFLAGLVVPWLWAMVRRLVR